MNIFILKISGPNTIYSQINEVEPGNVIEISTINEKFHHILLLLENTFVKKKII